ncbi:uncharacterized protein LOC134837638 [Culicoides brevitarsis]|uniref:uncharacterized protein LOC134837638 n=1 Tax=Culicoides brevitarsis TaxID=469753 RepID=UPI00307C7300
MEVSAKNPLNEDQIKANRDETINFIRNFLQNDFLKNLNAQKIVTEIFPDAEFIHKLSPTTYQTTLQCEGFMFKAESNKGIEKYPDNQASAMALKALCDISLPVYEELSYAKVCQKLVDLLEFYELRDQWKAAICINNETITAINASKSAAKNEVIKLSVRPFYRMHGETARVATYKALISFVLTKNHPFEQRVEFICRQLLPELKKNHDDPLEFLKPAEEIFSEDEINFLAFLYRKIAVETKKKGIKIASLTVNDEIISVEGKFDFKIKLELLKKAATTVPLMKVAVEKETLGNHFKKLSPKSCLKKARNLIKNDAFNKHMTPSKFWSMIHFCSSLCNCITFPSGDKAVITFDGVTFEGNGRTRDESKEIALYKMFYNYFHITLTLWDRYWVTNLEFCDPVDNFDEVQRQIQEKFKTNLKPHADKMWNKFGPKYPIEEVTTENHLTETRIRCHDQIFIATRGRRHRTRRAVAELALLHMFNLQHPHWNVWNFTKTRVFQRCDQSDYPSSAFFDSPSTPNMSSASLNTENSCEEDSEKVTVEYLCLESETVEVVEPKINLMKDDFSISAIKKRGFDILKTQEGQKLSPQNFWYQLVGVLWPIKTVALTSNNFLSSIVLRNGRTFREIGTNRDDSRNKVAAVVLFDVYDITSDEWNEFLVERTTLKDIIKSKVDKEKTFETELEALKANAKEFLNKNDTETLTPHEFWEATHRGTARMTVNTCDVKGNQMYEAIIEWLDSKFYRISKTKEEAMNSVAFSALIDLLSISFNKWKKYSIENEDNSEQKSLPKDDSKPLFTKLKEYQSTLHKSGKSLDEVPCSDIFNQIGINFQLDFPKNDPQNDELDKIKEITSRFFIKKLLDKIYNLDD